MSEESLFKSNLERWSLSHPEEAKKIAAVSLDKSRFKNNADGSLNLVVDMDGKEFLCHADHSPEHEAATCFSSLNLSNIEVVVVWGVGLGYIYDAASEWLKENEKHALVFVEPNPEVIARFFRTERASKVLFDKQVWLYHCNEKSLVLDDIAQAFPMRPFLITFLPSYGLINPEAANCFSARLSYFFEMEKCISSEYHFMGASFYRNFFKNMFGLPETLFAQRLKGVFHNVPAIICGAGPSLGKNLALLKTLQNKALIFGGGTAVNALDTVDMLPHFGLGIDPNQTHFTRLIMNRAYETPYFYKNRMYYEALNMVHGDHLFLNGCSGYPIAAWAEKKLGIEGTALDEGFNVINLALSTAQFLGCNPIIFVGLDLAYTDGASYPPGIVLHPLHDPKEHLRTKSSEDELVVKKDIFGQSVLTLWKWISESQWYSAFSKRNNNLQLINCTEGGLGFENIPNIRLADAAANILVKDYDFDTWIAGALQTCPMPPTVSVAEIQKMMDELYSGLKRCAVVCEAVIKNCEQNVKDLKAGKTVPPSLLTMETISLLGSLEGDSAITGLLRTYRDSFLKIRTEQRLRFELNEAYCGDVERLLKRNEQNLALYKYLKSVAESIAARISETINEYKANLPGRSLNALFRDKTEKNFRQTLLEKTTDPSAEVEERTYPSGKVMFRQHKKEGILEGPACFFSEEGEMLAWANFEGGMRQGDGYSFYHGGGLKSHRNYSKGKFDGKQLYYYPDGRIKSEIAYVNAVLDGDIKLYYPSGQLKRELHFQSGARHGFERVWNAKGLMVIEVQFENNKAVGIARMWYDTGNMAVEVVFNNDGTAPTYRNWNNKGFLVVREQNNRDYFENVGKQAGQLTRSIADVFKQVQNLAPLVDVTVSSDQEQKQGNALETLQADLNEIKKGLEAFQALSKVVEETYGSGGDAGKEIIWKTPSSKRILEAQVEGMSKAVSKDLKNIHDALSQAMRGLTDKFNRNDADSERKPKNHDR